MKTRLLFSIMLFLVPFITFCQQNDTWEKWTWLIGKWEGIGSGQPGEGSGTFSFSPDLDNNILIRKSHSEYPAKNNKPAVIHDDLMIIYLDETSNPSKAIYFDHEGHSINYVVTYAEKSIVFTSNKTTNMPVFRLTYVLLENDIVNTTFEMSQDGEKFMTYLEGKSKKK